MEESTTNTESTEAKETGTTPPPTPTKDTSCVCDGSSWKRFGCGLLIVFVLLAIWHVWAGSPSSNASYFVPASAGKYLEVNHLAGVSKSVARSSFWNEGDGTTAAKEVDYYFHENFAKRFGNVKPQVITEISQMIDGLSIGVLLDEQSNEQTSIAIRTHEVDAVTKILRKEVAAKVEDIEIGSAKAEQLTLLNGKTSYMVLKRPFVILTSSKELASYALERYHTEPSIADLRAVRREKAPMIQYVISADSLVELHVMRASFPNLFSPMVPTPDTSKSITQRINPKARLITRIIFPPSGTRAELEVIAPDEVTPHGTNSLLCYFLWFLGIIVAIIIGIPVLFLLVVLILAGYFYVAAWWRGELSPSVPPVKPELSPQAKEDMGIQDTPPPASQGETTTEDSNSPEDAPPADDTPKTEGDA